MVAFTRKEVISATQVVRQFSEIISSLNNHQREKVAIIKNNEMQAVILPIEEYEILKEQAEFAEHLEIYNMVKQREKTPKSEYIPWEDVLKNAGVNADEL